jgi:hypothetical protein
MSFFRELADEVKRELSSASSEIKNEWQKSMHGSQASPVAPGSQQQRGPASQQASHGQAAHGQRMPHSGVVARPANPPVNRNMPPEQRPQPQNRRKRAPQQQASANAQPQARTTTPVKAHKLVANLTPAVARTSIIMSEVLGPPVSKRQKRGWH